MTSTAPLDATLYCHHCDTLDGFHWASCPQYQPADDEPAPDECPRCGHTFDCYCRESDTVTACQSANRSGIGHTPTCTTCHDAGEIDPRQVAFPILGELWPCPDCARVLHDVTADWSGDTLTIFQGNGCLYTIWHPANPDQRPVTSWKPDTAGALDALIAHHVSLASYH